MIYPKIKKIFFDPFFFNYYMSGSKKSTSSLSEEEHQILRRVKQELKNQDIPRDQWPALIQSEISSHRLSLKKKQKALKKNPVISALKRIGKTIQTRIMKMLLKRQGQYSEEEIEKMMKAMAGEIPPEMAMPNVIPDTRIEDAGKHGTFLTTAQDHTRKKIEVFFDDDDDED
ncbi:hypothetical protein WKT22_04791 [Candidatus Lokiarchaeum ossiferum]